MKSLLSLLAVVLCASCSTTQPEAVKYPENPDKEKLIALPVIPVPGITPKNGVQKEDAEEISNYYFKAFVNGCGMPLHPVDRGECWSTDLLCGYAGSDCGRFWIYKDSGKVLLEPPLGGLPGGTKRILTLQGVQF